MKTRFIDRLLLALLLLIMFAVSLLMILLSLGLFHIEVIISTISLVFSNLPYLIALGAAGGILFVITLRLMLWRNPKPKEDAQAPKTTLIKTTDIGTSFITLSALDSMVQKHCRANNKIRNISSAIVASPDGGITISVKLSLMPDTDIPELTGELQSSLKEYIEKYSGITVREIGILIESTSVNPGARVE